MSPDTFPAGHRLGPYELVIVIGRGGGGEVYRARDHRLGRDVAVKTVRGPITREQVRRLELEARATAALNHHNIIAIYDVGTESDLVYVVTELLEGESLRARLRGGRIESSTAIGYAYQIADALAAAHGKGIVHRDLKPENVFVLPGGRIKLLDFGVAKIVAADAAVGGDVETMSVLTMAGDVVGTPAYLAPEQARGLAVDHRADVFSFGVVLHEMLTGESPFRRGTTADTLTAILRDSPEPIAGGSTSTSALNRIVQRCLEKDPRARFQSATDLRFALDGVSPQARRPVVRAGVVLAATAVVALVSAIGWSVYRSVGPAKAGPHEERTGDAEGAARPLTTETVAVSAPIDAAAIANVFPHSGVSVRAVNKTQLEVTGPARNLPGLLSVIKMAETLRGHRFFDEPSINGTATTVAPLFTGGGQSQARVSLSVDDASLAGLLQLIATAVGWPVIFDPSVKGNVTLDLRDVPWDAVVRSCLEFQGADLTSIRVGDVWLVSSKARAKELVTDLLGVWVVRSRRAEPERLRMMLGPAQTARGLVLANARLNAVVIVDQVEAFPVYARILASLDRVDAATLDFPRRSKQYSGGRVSLHLTGADFRGVLKTFSAISGLNIVADVPAPDLSKPTAGVHAHLVDTRWDNALEVLVLAASMVQSVHGNLIHVAPAGNKQLDETVEVISLKREDPSFFVQPFKDAGYLTPIGSMTTDPDSRTLVIRDQAHRVSTLKRLVKAVDERVR